MNPLKNAPALKILIIRFSSIGDILLTTPLLAALRQKHPDATIHYLTREDFAPLLRHHPAIDRLLTFDIRSGFSGLRRLKKQLGEYDHVLDIHNNLRSRFLFPANFPGRAKVARMDKNKLRRFLLVRAKINLYREVRPVWQKYLDTARALAPVGGRKMALYLPGRLAQNDELAALSENRIVIAPGAKHFSKRWPAEYFIELIVEIYQKYGLKSVLVGGAEEREMAENIVSLAGEDIVFSTVGKYALLETAALIKNGRLIICNDSGLMHVAACFEKPTVAIFGSTVRELGFFPLNPHAVVLENKELGCRPCSHIGRHNCPKKHFKCMREILPGDVLKMIKNKGWI